MTFARLISINLIVISVFMTGCAWRSPEGKVPVSVGQEPLVAPSVIPRRAEVHVSWKESENQNSHWFKRQATGGETELVTEWPVVIPEKIPNELAIEIASNQLAKRKVTTVVVQGELGQKGSLPIQLSAKLREDLRSEPEPNLIHLEVSDLKKAMHRSEEALMHLRLSFIAEGEKTPFETFKLSLVTPPRKLVWEQRTVSEHENAYGAIADQVKFLDSPGIKLALLQVISVRNESQWPVTVEIPVRLAGKLTTHSTRIDLKQAFCGYRLEKSERDEDLSSEIFAIPIADGSVETFLSRMNQAISNRGWKLQLASGGARLIGIYGEGTKAVELMRVGHRVERFSTVDAVNGCKSRCGNPRTDMMAWSPKNARSYWADQGWPGASRICDRLQNNRILPDQSYGDEEGMNLCAEWELSNGLAPWDDRRYCWSPAPGNPWSYPAREFWKVTKTTVPVEVGTLTGTVFLRFEKESVFVVAGFSFSDVVEQSEVTSFDNVFLCESKLAE